MDPIPQIIFIGGIFSECQSTYIQYNSIGPIQNAADAFQKNIIAGIDSDTKKKTIILNLPFVGSYPKRFKSAYFPSTVETYGSNSLIKGASFINIAGIKLISRTLASLKALFSLSPTGTKVIFVYSAHLPFILSALIYRQFNRNTKLCLIIPDLPEFMGEGGVIYKSLKRIDQFLFYRLVDYFDSLIVLTKSMIDRIHVDQKKCLVIEGIANIPEDASFINDIDNIQGFRSFLYTGTLALRYGIADLIEAFQKMKYPEIELWICGDGDGKSYVENSSKIDNRIKYFGQVDRRKAVELQKKASILVNPRRPEGEFTKYSFPSKILEYMASGRPVVMHKLDGIPEDYSPYYISPDSTDPQALAKCMDFAAEMSDEQLFKFGHEAQSFVLSNKDPITQAKKILNFVMEGRK